MKLEHNGYKEVCNTCNAIWPWTDDRCPECGSYDTDEFHRIECECVECKEGKRRPVCPECMKYTPTEELKMFGGLCETCYEEQYE